MKHRRIPFSLWLLLAGLLVGALLAPVIGTPEPERMPEFGSAEMPVRVTQIAHAPPPQPVRRDRPPSSQVRNGLAPRRRRRQEPQPPTKPEPKIALDTDQRERQQPPTGGHGAAFLRVARPLPADLTDAGLRRWLRKTSSYLALVRTEIHDGRIQVVDALLSNSAGMLDRIDPSGPGARMLKMLAMREDRLWLAWLGGGAGNPIDSILSEGARSAGVGASGYAAYLVLGRDLSAHILADWKAAGSKSSAERVALRFLPISADSWDLKFTTGS